MSPALQNLLGFTGTATEWAYGAMEVQAVPSVARSFDPVRLRESVDVLDRDEVEVRAVPFNATCEVALIRADDTAVASLWRCACALSTNCKDAGGVNAAKQRVTLREGTFTPSASCRGKPCVARLERVGGAWVDRSWPAACPLQ
jgi:hypothetical protein